MLELHTEVEKLLNGFGLGEEIDNLFYEAVVFGRVETEGKLLKYIYKHGHHYNAKVVIQTLKLLEGVK